MEQDVAGPGVDILDVESRRPVPSLGLGLSQMLPSRFNASIMPMCSISSSPASTQCARSSSSTSLMSMSSL